MPDVSTLKWKVCEVALQMCLDVIHGFEVRVQGAMIFCKPYKTTVCTCIAKRPYL